MYIIEEMMRIVLLLSVIGCLSQWGRAESMIQEDYPEDPAFKPLEDQCLLFPMTKADFKLWNTMGSAVLHKNKAIIAPETKN